MSVNEIFRDTFLNTLSVDSTTSATWIYLFFLTLILFVFLIKKPLTVNLTIKIYCDRPRAALVIKQEEEEIIEI